MSQDEKSNQGGLINSFNLTNIRGKKAKKGIKDLYNYHSNSGYIYINNDNISFYNNNLNKIDRNSSNNKNNMKFSIPSSSNLNKTSNYYLRLNNLYENNFNNKLQNKDISIKILNTAGNSYSNNIPNKINIQNYNHSTTKSFCKSVNDYYNFDKSYNNSLNYINNKTHVNILQKKQLIKERENNKENYNKINSFSLNEMTINKYNNINNKSIDLNKKKDKKSNLIKKICNYKNISKISPNKSIDLNKLLKKYINNSQIIHVNNGKIINLSNLNNFSYSTDKYNCFYENKRDTNIPRATLNINNKLNNSININNNGILNNNSNINIISKINNNKIKGSNITNNNFIKIHNNDSRICKSNNDFNNYNKYNNKTYNNKINKNSVSKNLNNSKTNNDKNIKIKIIQKKKNNIINNNPIQFNYKFPKKENTKYPLRINYTPSSLTKDLQNESFIEYNENKGIGLKNKKNFLNKRNFEKATSYFSNSFSHEDHIYNNFKNGNIYNNINNDDKVDKFKNNRNYYINGVNKTSQYFNTERFSSNDLMGNQLSNKTNKSIVIPKKYNIFTLEDKKDNSQNIFLTEEGTEKKQVKISNNIFMKYNYSTNNNYLNFNPIRKFNKNNNFKIKNNDRIMIINNETHKKIDSLKSNGISEKKKRNEYKISSNVVNEQIFKDKYPEKELSISETEDLFRMSMQSLDDSKMMEIANKYITDEENLDKNEILEILNSKKERY